MSKKFFTQVYVTGSNAENLADALAGLGEKKRTITALWFKPEYTTNTSEGIDVLIECRAYVEQTQVIKFLFDNFAMAVNNTNSIITQWAGNPRIECNIPLDVGQGFKVGFAKTGGTPEGSVTIEYVED